MRTLIKMLSVMCLSLFTVSCGSGGSEHSKQLTQYQINLVGHYILDSYVENGVLHDSADEQGEWGGELFLDDDSNCEYRVFEKNILTGSLNIAIWEEGKWDATSIALHIAGIDGLYWNESEPNKVGVDYGQILGLSIVWPNGRTRTEYWYKQTPPPRN